MTTRRRFLQLLGLAPVVAKANEGLAPESLAYLGEQKPNPPLRAPEMPTLTSEQMQKIKSYGNDLTMCSTYAVYTGLYIVPRSAHNPNCAWYGDSMMPCTCGADPSRIGHPSIRK